MHRLSQLVPGTDRFPYATVAWWAGLGTGLSLSVLSFGAGAAFLIGFSKTGIPGAGMPAITLMAEAFREDTKLSVGAMVPLLILGDIFGVVFFRRHANWHRLFEVLPYIVIGMIPGYFVLQWMQSGSLRTLIGILILFLLAVHVGCQRLGWQAALERKWFAGMMGLLAGFGTVAGNAAGPAMSIYLLNKKVDKHEFVGTSAWLFFLVNSSKVPFQAAMGVITWQTLRLDFCVLPLLFGGVLLGVFVHKRIPQRAFDSLVLVLSALAALQMVCF
jgi:uncharacterized membrane protein YfcA